MKSQLIRFLTALALCASLHQAAAQGTTFTYQGQLSSNGSPADGLYDFNFVLWTASSGGSQLGPNQPFTAVAVSNGLFTLPLNFGADIFNGQICWLQISVESNGVPPFVTLPQRQQLTPTPYAMFAENAGAVNDGSISAPQLNTAGAPTSGEVLEFNGTSLQWTTPAAGSSGWGLTGNANTTPGTDFLGTTDANALELRVNNMLMLLLDTNGNVVEGISNSVDQTVKQATIGGGYGNTVTANSGNSPTIGGGLQNTVSNLYPTVSGGEYNKALANGAVVGGGYLNTASGREATVAGGVENVASGIGAFIGGGGYDGLNEIGNIASFPATVVGGGVENVAAAYYAAVLGGYGNTASNTFAFVGGGFSNISSGFASSVIGGDQNVASNDYATVAGGYNNHALGKWSFAAGDSAQANNDGSFVWSDSSGNPFSSTLNNQFNIQATGGVRVVTGGAGMTIDGVLVGTGGGGGGNAWLLTGNTGANPLNGYFLGTTDDLPLELRVHGVRALRLDTSGNVVAGTALNTISDGFIEATIGGGGENTNSGNDATIAGGTHNYVFGNDATIGGGAGNQATAGWATVSGGSANTADGQGATVPGGQRNLASGNWSFAAGQNATAQFDGSFVWGDGTQPFYDNTNNSFNVLATGGILLDPGGTGVTILGDLDLEPNNDGNRLGDLHVAHNASVCTLTIRGGCDVAEPFEMSTATVVKGSVVVIDDQHAGQLKLSDRAYDTRVAGIVSGANGINPGLSLHQDGALQDGQNVALSGRVYVLADAGSGPIVPGDLLTTSDTPGHAMKVTDHAKAQGAILGKAMTGLQDGKGLVLVLVTLQ